MTTVTVEEATTRLSELIEKAAAGEEVVITRDDRPVAELRSRIEPVRRPRFGSMKGSLKILVEDDSYLDDFRDYMP